MAVETISSKTQTGRAPKPAPANKSTNNMVAIDTPFTKVSARMQAAKLREAEEDLARLQDQLMDVLEENQQMRAELEAWRAGARSPVQQAS